MTFNLNTSQYHSQNYNTKQHAQKQIR